MENDYIIIHFENISNDEDTRALARDLSILSAIGFLKQNYPDVRTYSTDEDARYRTISFIEKQHVLTILPPMLDRDPVHLIITCSCAHSDVRSFARKIDTVMREILDAVCIEPSFMETTSSRLDLDHYTFMIRRLTLTDSNREMFKLIEELATPTPFSVVK